jgi:hypothetical protein
MKPIAIFTVVILAGLFLFNMKATEKLASYLAEEGDNDMIGQEALKHV